MLQGQGRMMQKDANIWKHRTDRRVRAPDRITRTARGRAARRAVRVLQEAGDEQEQAVRRQPARVRSEHASTLCQKGPWRAGCDRRRVFNEPAHAYEWSIQQWRSS